MEKINLLLVRAAEIKKRLSHTDLDFAENRLIRQCSLGSKDTDNRRFVGCDELAAQLVALRAIELSTINRYSAASTRQRYDLDKLRSQKSTLIKSLISHSGNDANLFRSFIFPEQIWIADNASAHEGTEAILSLNAYLRRCAGYVNRKSSPPKLADYLRIRHGRVSLDGYNSSPRMAYCLSKPERAGLRPAVDLIVGDSTADMLYQTLGKHETNQVLITIPGLSFATNNTSRDNLLRYVKTALSRVTSNHYVKTVTLVIGFVDVIRLTSADVNFRKPILTCLQNSVRTTREAFRQAFPNAKISIHELINEINDSRNGTTNGLFGSRDYLERAQEAKMIISRYYDSDSSRFMGVASKRRVHQWEIHDQIIK